MSEQRPPTSKGAALRGTVVVEARGAREVARSVGILTVMSGAETGRVVGLPAGRTLDLGRSPECFLVFDDESVSSNHAQVVRFGSAYMFADTKSTNGSYVNDQRIAAPVQLQDGDRVQLGSNSFLRFSMVSEEEEAALRATYESGRRDGLTGVYNRKHLDERLNVEVTAAMRLEAPLSVIILDVDFFKKVNDTYGHLGGDAVLKAVAWQLTSGIRNDDLLARYGGEEFVVICAGISVGVAANVAERLRASIEKMTVPFDGQQIRITSSAGAASIDELGDKSPAALLALADERLYKAKQSGRNRVVAS